MWGAFAAVIGIVAAFVVGYQIGAIRTAAEKLAQLAVVHKAYLSEVSHLKDSLDMARRGKDLGFDELRERFERGAKEDAKPNGV